MKSIFLLILFSQALHAQQTEVPPPVNNIWQTLSMLAIVFLFFYFLLWRPEQKRRQLLEEQRGKLKVGDKVVAIGIVGTVAKIQEETVVLKMVDGSQIEVLKGAVTEFLNPSIEEKK